MRRSIAVILGLTTLWLLAPHPGHAASRAGKVASFTEMQKIVETIDDPQATLVVMDDDDTLTMMSCPDPREPETCQYLGGAAWFSWQQRQIDDLAQPRVANTFDGLLSVGTLLFSLNDMPYTARDVPGVLDQLVDSGVRVLVETARGNDTVSATERQLGVLHRSSGHPGTLLTLVSDDSLAFGPVKLASKASPYVPCPTGKAGPRSSTPPCPGQSPKGITYQDGVMYLGGQNKGEVLKCMLDEYNGTEGAHPIRHVVFLDDTQENVTAVQEAFADAPGYDVVALTYTALEEHKLAFIKGPMAEIYQENATKRWKAIKAALDGALQNPDLP